MNNRWLAFLLIGFFTLITFLFYWLTIKPIDLTVPASHLNPVTVTEPTVTFINPSKGAQNPRLTLVEFADFQCKYCQSIQIALEAALRAFPNDIRLVWKNLPNPSAQPESIPAAIAAHCANRQGKFWEFHDLLFARQDVLSPEIYSQIANELKLDVKRFSACFEAQDTMAIIQKDTDEGLALGLVATPTLFIGSQKIVGLITAEELIGVIQTELQKMDL